MVPILAALHGLEDMIAVQQQQQQAAQRRRRRRRRARQAQQAPPRHLVIPQRQPPIPRIRASPFNLTPEQIHTLYRLDRDTITSIVDMIHHDIVSLIDIRTAIPPLLKVVTVLHSLATGTYQHMVGQMHGISQPVFSRTLNQVLDALLKHASEHISLPRTAQEIANTKVGFYSLAGIPICIRAIDCTHVELVVPHHNEAVYRNRKQFHSINVQMVFDAIKIITHCCARFPGSTHDSMVLRNSTIPRYMERQTGQRLWLLGDAGYPLKRWLLTSVRNPQNRHEEDYNRAHTRTRVVIEQTFGLLKTRFRCISRSGGALLYGHEKVAKITMACVMLHNMCIRRNGPLPLDLEMQPPDEDDDGDEDGGDGDGGHARGDAQEGRDVRQHLINKIF
ncbi:putative nuclease HARBI1 [Ambystoma mexicanum]|uniref:putative nuclease HARBI1 n=1 Tax=Ambystoma mexicanum TaxID=8296 RepID=UPI0037E8CE04